MVDDEAAIVEIILAMLAECGYETRAAYDGAVAVEVAKSFLPDCVVTGIIMPRMDGIAEAREILKFHPDCKIIFHSSALTDENLRREIEDSGLAQAMMLKPFTRRAIRSALEAVGFPCQAG